jgi:predicted transcriptional regulator
MMKIATIRIEDDLNAEVNAVARADEVPFSEVFRAALYHYVAVRKADPQFQNRLRELLANDAAVIERLAPGGSE